MSSDIERAFEEKKRVLEKDRQELAKAEAEVTKAQAEAEKIKTRMAGHEQELQKLQSDLTSELAKLAAEKEEKK